MALTKGHGKLMFMGNVSVEEGEVSHNCPQHRLEIVCCVEPVNYTLCNTFLKLT